MRPLRRKYTTPTDSIERDGSDVDISPGSSLSEEERCGEGPRGVFPSSSHNGLSDFVRLAQPVRNWRLDLVAMLNVNEMRRLRLGGLVHAPHLRGLHDPAKKHAKLQMLLLRP